MTNIIENNSGDDQGVNGDNEFFDEKNSRIRRYLHPKTYSSVAELIQKPKKQLIRELNYEGESKRKRERKKIGEIEAERFIGMIDGHSLMAGGTDTRNEYVASIRDRTLTEADYNRIMEEINKNSSILPRTQRRAVSFGGGEGDVILSRTTGAMYCVADRDQFAELLQHYKGKQYHFARSGKSGHGYIIAGKKSLIYLPTVRKDVKNVRTDIYSPYFDGLKIYARSDGGIVDRSYPVTIACQNKEYAYAFIDPNKVQDIFGTLESGGQLPESYQVFTVKAFDYIDENGVERSYMISYLAEKEIDSRKLQDILNWSGSLRELQSKLQLTGSEFERVLGIYKLCDNYVQKGRLGVATKSFGPENPRIDQEPEYILDNKQKIQIFTNASDLKVKGIRGWSFHDKNTVYRKEKGNPGYYKVMREYSFRNELDLDGKADILMSDFGTATVGASGYGDYQSLQTDDNIFVCDSKRYVNNGKVIVRIDGVNKRSLDDVLDVLDKQDHTIKEEYEKSLHTAFKNKLGEANMGITDGNTGRNKYKDLVYTQFGDKVFLGIIIKQTDLHQKFSVLERKNNLYQDYEYVITEEEWLSHDSEYWFQYMKKKALVKSNTDYMYIRNRNEAQQIDEVKKFLTANPDKKFFIQDSFDAGNCEPGTEGFMQSYELYDGIEACKLLENKKFHKMLQNGKFRNVILRYVVTESVQDSGNSE